YVFGQIHLPDNLFLFYSSTALNKFHQFKCWFIIQLIISLPIAFYGVFTLVIGSFFGYYITPLIILLYILLLAVISAFVYVKYISNPIRVKSKSILLRIVNDWQKPFFSLFFYHVLDKLKITFAITKVLSLAVINGGFYFLTGLNNDLRVLGIVTLGIIIAHAFLIYQSYRFESLYLNFSRNFPYSKNILYLNWAVNYLLLTLPENIWHLTAFDFKIGSAFILFNLGTGMLFRSLLYRVALDMKKFLYWVFYLFIFFFLVIMQKLYWLLIPINLLLSIILFYKNYYKQSTYIKS
ncbi:MAG: hypothetical protein AAGI07_04610, partial [Bacteroidota bacterium]